MRASSILSIRIEYFPNPASGKSCFPVGRRAPESTMNMPSTVLTDLVLLLLFLLLMAAPHTGGAVHEWLGVLLTFALVLHAWLNRVWYKSLLKGRYNVTRAARLALNALLLLMLLGTLASAVPISRTVFAFLGLKGGLAARTIHVFCAHWCFLLAAVHLGVYGRRFCAPSARLSADLLRPERRPCPVRPARLLSKRTDLSADHAELLHAVERKRRPLSSGLRRGLFPVRLDKLPPGHAVAHMALPRLALSPHRGKTPLTFRSARKALIASCPERRNAKRRAWRARKWRQ